MPSSVLRAVHDLSSRVLDLLLPPRCVGCRDVGPWLCETCLGSIPRIEAPFCARCGDEIRNPTSDLCPRCQTVPLQIERIRSAVFYEGVLRRAVHKFKYEGITALAAPLGGLMTESWSRHALPTDVVVPVPLHEDRLRERGFNQAALLARELSQEAGLPVDEETLVRHRSTASQVGLDAEERVTNVRGAFRCTSKALERRRVLLVDDLCTTGSTLEACAVALREGGASSVQGLTLARARRTVAL